MQLNPSLLIENPLGRRLGLFLIDYEMYQNSCWGIALKKDNIVKNFYCNDVIQSANFTYHSNTTRNTNHY